jgi:hypothetical protein
LIGKEVLNKIKIVVTDGDSQEIGQLEDTVTITFPMSTKFSVHGISLTMDSKRR